MSAPAQGSQPVRDEEQVRKVQLWQIAVVVLGFVLLLAHPLIGTKLPLPGGGVIAGLLLPALLFVLAFLPAAKRPRHADDAQEDDAQETVSVEPGAELPARTAITPSVPAASRVWSGLRVALRRAHREQAERRSARADRSRVVVYLVVPVAAILSLAIVGLYGAVACFGVGAIVLMLLGWNASQ